MQSGCPGTLAWYYLLLIALVVFLVAAAGCSSSPAPSAGASAAAAVTVSPDGVMTTPTSLQKDVAATVERSSDGRIIVTYLGGRDAGLLMELQTSLVDSRGTIATQSMGSRLDTTPVQKGGTTTFSGTYKGRTHVVSVGFFNDGTHQDILDTWV